MNTWKTNTKELFINIDQSEMSLTPINDKSNRNSGAVWYPVLSVSHDNEKMGGAVASVSFAIECTCNENMPCYSECYAARMENHRPSIYNSYLNNYIIYKKDKKLFFNSCKAAMLTSMYFRFFVAGDIPDSDFLPMVWKLCHAVPHCKVLIFTKKFFYVNEMLKSTGGKKPRNLSIILSEWKGYKIQNPYNLPTAGVYNEFYEMPCNSYICGGSCTICNAKKSGCFYAKPSQHIAIKKH